MPRNESDREDLMREATAFVRRAEFHFPGEAKPVVIGQKRSGAWSVYLGDDPVYQFDASGGLRRAFVDHKLFRTQGTTLAQLTRERSESESWLARHDLTDIELAQFRHQATEVLNQLLNGFEQGSAKRIQEQPMGTDCASEFVEVLRSVLSQQIRLAAPIKGKS